MAIETSRMLGFTAFLIPVQQKESMQVQHVNRFLIDILQTLTWKIWHAASQ